MKIFDRGYWVSHHFYWQSMYHYLTNSLMHKSMTYFSACNPAIELGGMLHDRKSDIYALLPSHIVPRTAMMSTYTAARAFVEANDLTFPLIIKPNVGVGGFKVATIHSDEELQKFFEKGDLADREWLLQEFLSHEKEFSVLVYRYPTSGRFGISSFVEKVYPAVIADGSTTIRSLIEDTGNPFLDKDMVYARFVDELDRVPHEGEKVVLDVIGNYKRGAKFVDRYDLVDQEMTQYLQRMFEAVPGLNFFRIDFKSDSIDAFLRGEWKVLEINGAKSEPLHIYDNRNSFLKNVQILKDHWRTMAEISEEMRTHTFQLPSFRNGVRSWLAIRRLVK